MKKDNKFFNVIRCDCDIAYKYSVLGKEWKKKVRAWRWKHWYLGITSYKGPDKLCKRWDLRPFNYLLRLFIKKHDY